MHRTRRSLTALAGVGALAVILATPSPALAKSDYGVTISGKHVRAGATVTVTVSMDDDAGIDPGARMCLFQIVGDHAPTPHSTYGFPDYAIPAGSRYVKVADCRRPVPDAQWAGTPQYDSGTTTYRLKVTSGGWLALAAFREENHVRMNTGGPILSNIVFVSGSGGAKPGAAAARTAVVSVGPAPRPSGQASPSSGSPAPAASSPADPATEPSDLPAAGPQAARKSGPGLGWLAAAATGALLIGGLITAIVVARRSRARS